MNPAYNQEFYRSFVDLKQTKEVPPSWFIVLTDIKGSTQTSQQGRYESVNYIGSAAIAAVRNEFGNKKIPFVFGGDGATFLVPPENLDRLLAILNSLRDLALKQMGFILRVETIRVDRVTAKGTSIRLGFVPVGPIEGFHFFRGNGIAAAEKILKNGEGDQFPFPPQLIPVNLNGLSCRVSPFQPLNGTILNVIIEPLVTIEEEDKIFEEIFPSLKKLDELCPIKPQTHSRPWISSKLSIESSLNQKKALRLLIEHLITKLIFKLNLRSKVVGLPSDYTEALLIQSDWIKMDGTLRMVLDVDEETKKQLLGKLETLSELGKIRFGISQSDSVVMTCHLLSAEQQGHIHFVDGSSCGLTRAATALKKG